MRVDLTFSTNPPDACLRWVLNLFPEAAEIDRKDKYGNLAFFLVLSIKYILFQGRVTSKWVEISIFP
jgi:hypothetical protein